VGASIGDHLKKEVVMEEGSEIKQETEL